MGVLLLAAFGAVLATNPPMPAGAIADSLQALAVGPLLVFGVFAFWWQKVFLLFGLYDPGTPMVRRREWATVGVAASVGSAPVIVLTFLGYGGPSGMSTALSFWSLVIPSTLVGRALVRSWPLGRRPATRRVLVVGSGPRALTVFHSVRAHPEWGCELLGFVDSNEQVRSIEIDERMLGSLEQLERILMHTVVDEVVITLPMKSCYAQIQSAIEICEQAGVVAKYSADLFTHAVARPCHDQMSQTPVITMAVVRDDYRLVIKRSIDVIGAAVAFVLLLPPMVAIAAAIKLTSPGPVLFAQQRYGYRKRRFTMYKFRTMVPDAEALQGSLEGRNEINGPVFKIKGDPRVTRLGSFLRVSSLDELPQLFNVMRGEMSLVGPRPLPVRDVDRFTEAWPMRRFSVRPGLTCLWQISGRSNVSFGEWMKLDLQYIDQWSLALDLRILARTIPVVLSGAGAV